MTRKLHIVGGKVAKKLDRAERLTSKRIEEDGALPPKPHAPRPQEDIHPLPDKELPPADPPTDIPIDPLPPSEIKTR